MKRRSDTLVNLLTIFYFEDESLHELLQILPEVKRRKTHKMIENRNKEGAFSILVQRYLLSEDDKFIEYFRVSPNLFHRIHEHIRDQIETIPCNRVQHPISSQQKLCLALRYILYEFQSFILQINICVSTFS